ncbi:hypothetical protein L1987_38767 [Smallanthus sonchifolius]|uniref:Uncharacterized protein n=1 Tax=Smallanthus sonchifolius TaxID=185202 RepID=A0ACB9HJK2_9ASTR|nr:hypothetical protein L1987_38767 [Smallanthus sonchifolius]
MHQGGFCVVALKHKNGACASLLNPSSAEQLVWPSPLKFISEQDAKALFKQALMEVNREREKNILKGSGFSVSSPSHSDATGIDDNIAEASDSQLELTSTFIPLLSSENQEKHRI